MTCIALDDEPLALQLLESYAARLPAVQPKGFFNNPDEARSMLQREHIDLLFLDIQMPDINGLQFLRQIEHPPMVIFTTAFAEYAIEGFNLDAVDYLLKPYDFQRFEKAISKAIEYKHFLETISGKSLLPANTNSPDCLFVRVGYSVTRIALDDIRYIEGFDDYIKIHVNGRPILTLLSLKRAMEMLPPGQFLRIHRSFIVALDKIERIRAQKVSIGGRELPIGDTFKEKLKLAFSGSR